MAAGASPLHTALVALALVTGIGWFGVLAHLVRYRETEEHDNA